jgi:polyphosphate kinase
MSVVKQQSSAPAKSKRRVPRKQQELTPDSPQAYFNRELSWLAFARRVMAQVEDPQLPLLERVKFAGIIGMLHDEFFMKRMGGLKRMVRQGATDLSMDGRTAIEEIRDCRVEIQQQSQMLARLFRDIIRPELAKAGVPILDYRDLGKKQQEYLASYFENSIQPILTPLAVDAEHPFPFISNLGLNLAIQVTEQKKKQTRFVRLKVPGNRPRWVQLDGGEGYVPIEQVIAAHLGQFFPRATRIETYFFKVIRGVGVDDTDRGVVETELSHLEPGAIIGVVTNELKARRFAGVTRVLVSSDMPEKMQLWLAEQMEADPLDIYATDNLLGLSDLLEFNPDGRTDLRLPSYEPVVHPRLRGLATDDPSGIFDVIRQGDLLLHHPYQGFDSSVLRFIQSAALDPQVLAIKLTIYRTSSDSPIIKALVEACRRGKQVAVLIEVTARFDEAPNIAWGQMLEREGAHVAYGVEKLKTHLKLALAVREEEGGIRRYFHVGTGNYHTGTARFYVDLGMLSANPDIADDIGDVFNELTSATDYQNYRKLVLAPDHMRERFVELIRREAANAAAGRPSGIRAKMNQLSDLDVMKELYKASMAGVPITLDVRGLCCLRPGLPGLSENIRVFSVVGRFLEHSRLYRFENAGRPEYYLGSADWMRRNLDRRVESLTPIGDGKLQSEVDQILGVYESDNTSAWDLQSDGSYVRRVPRDGEEPLSAQRRFMELARGS